MRQWCSNFLGLVHYEKPHFTQLYQNLNLNFECKNVELVAFVVMDDSKPNEPHSIRLSEEQQSTISVIAQPFHLVYDLLERYSLQHLKKISFKTLLAYHYSMNSMDLLLSTIFSTKGPSDCCRLILLACIELYISFNRRQVSTRTKTQRINSIAVILSFLNHALL